jgi:hypothetical protein
MYQVRPPAPTLKRYHIIHSSRAKFSRCLIIWKFRGIRRGVETVGYSEPKGKENEILVLFEV